MRTIARTSQFKKDVKRLQKRGADLTALKSVIIILAAGEKLEARLRDHPLIGEYKGTRECHLAPDWLLIYSVGDDWIRFERTGTHSDLFE